MERLQNLDGRVCGEQVKVFKKIEVSEHGKVRIVWVDSSDPVITGGEENFPPFLSGGLTGVQGNQSFLHLQAPNS